MPSDPMARFEVTVERYVDGCTIHREEVVRWADLDTYITCELMTPGDLLNLDVKRLPA